MSDKPLPHTLRIILRALAISGVLSIGVGCGIFDPGKDNGKIKPPPFQYPPLDSPQHTLTNLKLAWENEDSTRTRQVYDDDYVGTAPNPDPQQPPYTFTKDQEVAVVWAIGQDPAIFDTVMELRPESTWVRLQYPSDPEGWATIQLLQGVKLQVWSTGPSYDASTSGIEYKFKPYVTGTDTTWKIVRWTEIVN